MRVLFASERFSADAIAAIGRLLPGWDIARCGTAELAEHLKGVDVVCPVASQVDAAVLRSGTFGLVQQFGVGLENVDVATATELGVWVARLPADLTGNADAVAEIAVLDLLALMRRFDEARATLADPVWTAPVGVSLAGATVLVVGLGAIGDAVARRLIPFGPRLLATRAHPERGGLPGVAEVGGPGDLHRLLGEADAVVCAAMYEAGTPPLFDAAAFAAMKRGARFVNVARGGLVDEDALLAALDSGHVAGAGLDVFAVEPSRGPLVRHPKVIATPHVGGLTIQMFLGSANLFAENVARWAGGEPPLFAVNEPPAPRR